MGDGDWRLIAACSDKKMRVIKGTALSTTAALLDEPAAMATFYPDERTPRLPSVAVAAGSYVFIYRNMRPYFKVRGAAVPGACCRPPPHTQPPLACAVCPARHAREPSRGGCVDTPARGLHGRHRGES